jgi:ribosomal-protein-alanine N-acetyltransferase
MLTFKPAKHEDMDTIHYLEQKAFGADAYDMEMIMDSFLESGDMTIIAFLDDEPAGYVMAIGISEKSADIESICVSPDFQGKGIGKALLHVIEDTMRSHGFSESVLEVRVFNESALSMYRKEGYSITNRLENFYQGEMKGSRDAFRMRKTLQ